jgi:FtsP/CotA-like multicopper oxidase with cupredoxin domain
MRSNTIMRIVSMLFWIALVGFIQSLLGVVSWDAIDEPALGQRSKAARLRLSLIPPVLATETNPCSTPTNYQRLPEVSGEGNIVAPMSIEQGVADNGRASLCFVYQQATVNPVIRLQRGYQLSLPLTSRIRNDADSGTVNCAIQTFVAGGECAQPEAGFIARPGQDDPYYPIESMVPELADGTTNVHTHGFFVSPLPCHDEVIRTTLYPVNWGGPISKLLPCQLAPNSIHSTFDIPSDHPAGAYWYHAHRHMQEEPQLMMGESGPIIVESEADQRRKSLGVTDDVLMIRDIPAANPAASGMAQAQASPGSHRRQMNALHSQMNALHRMTQVALPANEGPVFIDPRIDRANEVACRSDDPDTGGPPATQLTLNGAVVPETEQFPPGDDRLLTKTMNAGERQVWRVVNGSADTTISPQLVLLENGQTRVLPLVIIARDGVPVHTAGGAQIRDTGKDPLLVPTAGRVEILVHAPPPGATLYLDSQQVTPGCAGDAIPARRLLRVVSTGVGAFPSDDGDILFEAQDFTRKPQPAPEVHRVMAFTEFPRQFTVEKSGWSGPRPGPADFDPNATDFFLTMIQSSDGQAAHPVIHPFHPTSPPDVVVYLDERDSVTEEWTVQNYTLEIHTFHMHQTHFRDITNGDNDNAPVLDTIVVPPATRGPSPSDPGMDVPMTPGQVILRMTFTRTDIGQFVFHCHIGEHTDNGMMQKIAVVP